MTTTHDLTTAAAAVGRYQAVYLILDHMFTDVERPDLVRSLVRQHLSGMPVPDPVPEPGNPADDAVHGLSAALAADADLPDLADPPEAAAGEDAGTNVARGFRWYVLTTPGVIRPPDVPDDAEPFAVEQGMTYWRYRA